MEPVNFANIIGRSNKEINKIIAGKKTITPVTAVAFSVVLGTSAEYRLSLEATYTISTILLTISNRVARFAGDRRNDGSYLDIKFRKSLNYRLPHKQPLDEAGYLTKELRRVHGRTVAFGQLPGLVQVVSEHSGILPDVPSQNALLHWA
jgi:plasmid maintenance system antidote protein VapI